MEHDYTFHLKVRPEGRSLNGVSLDNCSVKTGKWNDQRAMLFAIPMDRIDFDLDWPASDQEAAVLPATQDATAIPATRAEMTEPELAVPVAAAAVATLEPEAPPAPARTPVAPVRFTAPEVKIPVQGRFAVQTPELKPVSEPQPVAESKQEPVVGLPSDEEVAELHEISSAADIAKSYDVSEEEVKEAIRRAVKARVPIETAPAQKAVPQTAEGMDPARWAELEATSVTVLPIHANAVASLHTEGIDTLAQLIVKQPRQLAGIPGIGPTYVKSIRSALTSAGLELPQDDLALSDLTKVRRALGGLKSTGIASVEQLCELTRSKLAGIEGVGAKEAGNIAVELAARGLSLKSEKS